MKRKHRFLSLIMTLAMITTLFAGLTISASATGGTWAGSGTASDPYAAAPSVTIKLSENDDYLIISTTVNNVSEINGLTSSWFAYLQLPDGCNTLGEDELYEEEPSWGYWCIEKQDNKYFIEADYDTNSFEFKIPLHGVVKGDVTIEPYLIRVNNQELDYSDDSVLSLILGSSSGGDTVPAYTAFFDSPSVTTIEPTSEQPFTVPVILTSDSLLSGAELDLSCNADVAKITNVTLASGLTANGNHSIAADGSSAKISFYGNEQSAKDGLTVATVTMQPVAEGTSSLSITQGTAATSGTTLEYPVTVPESPVTVEVKSQDTISTSTYVSTSEGVVTLLKYTPGIAPAEGKVPAYEGALMMKGPDGSWLYLVKGEPDKTKISMTDGVVTNVAHPSKGDTVGTLADLNDTEGRVNIVDAQIAYDIATGQYTEIAPELTGTAVDLLHWLMADVTGDEKVDTLDARAIQAFIHTNEWFKDSAASA